MEVMEPSMTAPRQIGDEILPSIEGIQVDDGNVFSITNEDPNLEELSLVTFQVMEEKDVANRFFETQVENKCANATVGNKVPSPEF